MRSGSSLRHSQPAFIVRGLLSPRHYIDPAVFAEERERIFSNCWIFAGLASLVAEPDQFFTCEIAGRDVVVQNFNGEIRAFENICRHRGKRIQTDAFGKRQLVCGYHGWRYAANGEVAIIPLEAECYRLGAEEREKLQLPAFALERIGQLLFVCVADHPIDIHQQLSGEVMVALESVSNAFDGEIMVTSFEGRYNWKLAYENLRDSLHPRFVHTKSLNTQVAFEPFMSASMIHRDGNGETPPLPDLSFGGAEGTFRNDKAVPFHSMVERWGDNDSYFNWLLYPSTHIVSPDGGYLFSIEHHVPVAPDRTRLMTYFVTGKKKRSSADISSVLWEYAQGAKTILDEDTRVMEETHAGIVGGAPVATIGDVEVRNRLTDRWYLDRMN